MRRHPRRVRHADPTGMVRAPRTDMKCRRSEFREAGWSVGFKIHPRLEERQLATEPLLSKSACTPPYGDSL
jgi:hypothetical protein